MPGTQKAHVRSSPEHTRPEISVIEGRGTALQALKEIPSPFRKIFDNVEKDFLTITTPKQNFISFGDSQGDLKAHWILHRRECFREIVYRGSLGLGESYMKGWWEEENDRLTDLVGVFLRSSLQDKAHYSFLFKLQMALKYLINSPLFLINRRRCVRHHYDLSNDFFKLFLDPTMTYSCGYQLDPADTLDQMQEQKYQLICDKLHLEKGGELLDIGCGWGGLLIHAASRYPNIRGTGITISKKQYDLAQQRVAQKGLRERIQIKLCDYLDLQGSFDFIASIGMFEHVGRAAYPRFMKKVKELLAPDGLGLLHTIGSLDPLSFPTEPWIATYIFPGGYLPRLDEIAVSMRRFGLLIGHVENLKPHYAETLRKWKINFDQNRERIRSLDSRFDDVFLRIWNYFLQSCEACFRYGNTQVYQVLFCNGPEWNFPLQFKHSPV